MYVLDLVRDGWYMPGGCGVGSDTKGSERKNEIHKLGTLCASSSSHLHLPFKGCCVKGACFAYSVEFADDKQEEKEDKEDKKEGADVKPTTDVLLAQHLVKAANISAAVKVAGAAGAAPTAVPSVPPQPPASETASGSAEAAGAAGAGAGSEVGYRLQLTGRYCHSKVYVKAVAEEHGFKLLAQKEGLNSTMNP